MKLVTPKKKFGQHFLKDIEYAEKVACMFKNDIKIENALEIGPGMGVLTNFLVNEFKNVVSIEIDTESVDFLNKNLKIPNLKVIEGDFLKLEISEIFNADKLVLIGNFPYNISTQIVFKLLENPNKFMGFGGMFQKEVAERLCAKEGSKTYGILSVFLNTYFNTEYLFTINEDSFIPPPKVKTGVIKCVLKENFELECSKTLYFDVVKTAFNQRRKTLRNALSKFKLEDNHKFAKLRAEQLSWQNFVELTKHIDSKK